MALALGFRSLPSAPLFGRMFAPIDGPIGRSWAIQQRPVFAGAKDQVVIDPIYEEAYLVRAGQLKKIGGLHGTKGHKDGVGSEAIFCHGGYYGTGGSCVTDGAAWYFTQRNGQLRIAIEKSDGTWMFGTFAACNTQALAFAGGFLWATEDINLIKFDLTGARVATYKLPFAAVSLPVDDGGGLWGMEAGGTYNVMWRIDMVTGIATRFAGLSETEVHALEQAGQPIPVDGPIDNCTIHTSGPFWISADRTQSYIVGGDETAVRRIKDGRISTLQNDGSYKEVQVRGQGFQVGVEGAAYGEPYPLIVNSNGQGFSQWLEIIMGETSMGMAGYLDMVDGASQRAAGWCYDSSIPDASVLITVDNNPIGTVIANQMRADIKQYNGGLVGWSIDIPQVYGDGLPHNLAAFHNGQQLAASPKTFSFVAQGGASIVRNIIITLTMPTAYTAPGADKLTKYQLMLAGQILSGPLTQTGYKFMGVAAGTYTLEIKATNDDGSVQVLRASGSVVVSDVTPVPDPTVMLASAFTVTLE